MSRDVSHRSPLLISRTALVALALLGVSGCESCSGTKGADPRQYLPRSAEAVFEVSDIGYLAKRRTQLEALTSGVVTPAQLQGLKSQLARWLGFDVTDEKKLKEAGLSHSGSVVGSFSSQGRDVLWIIPIVDEAKFKETAKGIVQSKRRIDATKEEKTEAGNIVVHSTSWGTETLPVAAVSVKQKLGFLAHGPNSQKLVAQALVRKPEQSILTHPEFQALDKALDDSSIVRLIVPTATAAAAQALRAQALLSQPALADVITSLAWSIGWKGQAINAQGRFRMKSQMVEKIQQVLKPRAKRSDTMTSLVDVSSVFGLHATGNPQKLIEVLKEPNTPISKQFARLSTDVKTNLGIDLDKDVFGLLTGHAAASARLIDLSTLTNLNAIMQNPSALARYSVGLGLDGKSWKKRFDTLLMNFEPQLQARGVQRNSKVMKNIHVDTMVVGEHMLVESYIAPDAWILTNDDEQSKALLDTSGSSSQVRLSELGGVHAFLNLSVLRQALEKVDIGRLTGGDMSGMMLRAIISKAVQALSRLDRLDVKLEAAPDGMVLESQLKLAPIKSSK